MSSELTPSEWSSELLSEPEPGSHGSKQTPGPMLVFRNRSAPCLPPVLPLGVEAEGAAEWVRVEGAAE